MAFGKEHHCERARQGYQTSLPKRLCSAHPRCCRLPLLLYGITLGRSLKIARARVQAFAFHGTITVLTRTPSIAGAHV